MAGCAAYGPPRIAGEKVYRRVVYASPDGHALKLDLYVPPKADRPAPVVIWIFGGSWKFGSRGYHLNVRNLTRAGIAVAAIDYRLSGTAIFPAQLQDCQAAAQWLRENGARHGLDPARIAVAGESSGGHLAALLGTLEGRDRIRAVCAIYPVTDLVALGRQYAYGNPSDIERLLGGPIEERLDLARSGSPVNHVGPATPPFLLIHGEKDSLVPISNSEWLNDRLQAQGIETKLLVVPGREHWFALDPALSAQVATFFQRHLGVAPKP